MHNLFKLNYWMLSNDTLSYVFGYCVLTIFLVFPSDKEHIYTWLKVHWGETGAGTESFFLLLSSYNMQTNIVFCFSTVNIYNTKLHYLFSFTIYKINHNAKQN